MIAKEKNQRKNPEKKRRLLDLPKPVIKVSDISAEAHFSLSELLCISEIDQSLRNSATRAAVDAILGKFLSSNDSRETAIHSSPLVDDTAPPPSIVPVASSSSPDDQPVPPNNTNTIAEQFKTALKCPICDKTPYHLRSRCPLIKSGITAMRKRVAELQQNTPDGNDEEREDVIEELQRLIDKRTKRNKTRAKKDKSTNVISMADKSVISPTPTADSSSIVEALKTSLTVEPAKAWSLEDEPVRSWRRIQNSRSEVREEEEEEEASPFMRSIIPLPTTSASEPLNEDKSSRSEDLQGDTSFHDVNDLGSSMEADKTGDAAIDDAYALDFAHVSALKPSEDSPQSDPIETSEKPESSLFPQSPIVSIEDDIHPRQSTPMANIAGRTRSQRISSTLVRKPTGFTFKPHNASSRTVNGIKKNSKSTKTTGGFSRITDLPIPIISKTKLRSDRRQGLKGPYIESSDSEAVHPEKTFDEEDHQQAARAGEEGEETDEQGPTDASQPIPKTPAKTPAKVPVPSTIKRNAEQSLASWAVLTGNSPAENGSLSMVDELRYSPDTQRPESPAANGVSKESDPLFLHSETQQSFPYSQYPDVLQECPDSEDEEDEVQAFVVKPQKSTKKSSSKFRSLTEIASQPTLFTPTMHLPQNNGTKKEVMNLYGRANKGEEESSDSDTESESDGGAKKQSHIPKSRRAGTLQRSYIV